MLDNHPDLWHVRCVNEKIDQIRLSAGCGGDYSAQTEAAADNLTVVADGQKQVFDFGV